MAFFSRMMKRVIIAISCCLLSSAYAVTAFAAPQIKGEAEFKDRCAACHADGGNIMNPAKTLSKKDREKSGIKTVNDVIKVMRKPTGEMIAFDKNTLPDKEAKLIAEYIIKTFK